MHLLPKANVPVVQISLDMAASPESMVALGQALAPLREEGIALMGSGSLTHNLYHVQRGNQHAAPDVVTFQKWVRHQVKTRTLPPLIAATSEAPGFREAHPTDDHYLPLLFAMGAEREGDQLQVMDAGVYHSALAMESYLWQSLSA